LRRRAWLLHAQQDDRLRRSHNHLRDLLDSGHMAARIVNSYLSGSYARDTPSVPWMMSM
jgi:hypothetical protein